jgi:hypothetical protein
MTAHWDRTFKKSLEIEEMKNILKGTAKERERNNWMGKCINENVAR